MSDLISRQAVLDLKTIAPIAPVMNGEDVHYEEVIFVRDLERLPSVEPERKTGRWIWENEEIIYGNIICHALRCKCSECSFVIDRYEARFINYCPKCGAKMEVD